MQILGHASQDIDEALTYGIQWGGPLQGATISSTTWTAVPDDVTLVAGTQTTTTAAVRVSGGRAGMTYKVVNTVVASTNDRMKAAFTVAVEG